MLKEKLAIIIPTKNRSERLKRLLESISSQEIQPVQVIIVDSGDGTSCEMVSKFSNLHIDYMKASSSLTMQRNIGLKMLKPEINFVAFFDDDIELHQYTLNTIMDFFSKAAEDIIGVACNIISHPRNKTSYLEKFFLLGNNRIGAVLPSGFQSSVCSVDNDYQVQWLVCTL